MATPGKNPIASSTINRRVIRREVIPITATGIVFFTVFPAFVRRRTLTLAIAVWNTHCKDEYENGEEEEDNGEEEKEDPLKDTGRIPGSPGR